MQMEKFILSVKVVLYLILFLGNNICFNDV